MLAQALLGVARSPRSEERSTGMAVASTCDAVALAEKLVQSALASVASGSSSKVLSAVVSAAIRSGAQVARSEPLWASALDEV